MLNLNDFAIEITKQEAGKTQVSITQVKEIMKIIFTKIAKMPAEERMAFMTKLPSNTNNKTGGTSPLFYFNNFIIRVISGCE